MSSILDALNKVEHEKAAAAAHEAAIEIDAETAAHEMLGRDLLRDRITVRFTAGQKTAVVHLPFTPPLESIPEIECEPSDDADVRLRTAAVQTYGARIEVRRTEPVETAANVEIAYAAVAPVSRDRAA